MDQETFKPHPIATRYQVGTHGTILTPYGRKIKCHADKAGYIRAAICAPGVSHNATVHRLVAQTHVPNPNNLPEVNHIDHDKANNRAENLEWVTHADNLAKARAFHGNWVRSGGASPVAKALKATPIEGGEPVIWASATEFVRAKGGKAGWLGNISRAIRTQRPAYGHRWAFA